MPMGDGTGPAGMGPMTGRAAGYCAGYSVPGFANPYGGRYFGIGRRAGYRNWFYATGLPGWYRYGIGIPAWGGVAGYPYYASPYMAGVTTEEEERILKNQSDMLKKQLDNIQSRMEELKKESEEKEE